MAKIVIMDHPLIRHKIGLIRRKEIGTKEFRETIGEIAMLECYEATRELELEDVEIETPICKTTVQEIKGKKLAVVPILRAGLGTASCRLIARRERSSLRIPCSPPAVPLWRLSNCSRSTAARSCISSASLLLLRESRPSQRLIPMWTSILALWMIISTITVISFPDWATQATGSSAQSDRKGRCCFKRAAQRLALRALNTGGKLWLSR